MSYRNHTAVLSLIHAIEENSSLDQTMKENLIVLLTEHIELVELVKGAHEPNQSVKRPTIEQIRMGAMEGWPAFELATGYGAFSRTEIQECS